MEEAKVRGLLDLYRVGEHPRGTHAFDALTFILLHHPTWKERLVSIQAARVRRKDNALFLQIKTKSKWFSVSWRACLIRKRAIRKDARPPEIKKLHEAMRTCIRSQMSAWRRHHPNVCVLCKATGKLDVDHSEPSFKSIRDAFLEQKPQEEWPTQFGFGKRCATAFLPQDANFKQAFQRFHAHQAKFQFLCRACNLRKGTS